MCRLYLLYRRLWVVPATCCAVPSTHRAQVVVESLNCSHSFATIIELLIDATLLYLKATVWCSLPKYLPHRWIIPSPIDFQNWMLNYLPPAKNRFCLSSSVVVAGNMSVLPWGKFVKKFHSLSCGWYAQQSYLRIKPTMSPITWFCDNQMNSLQHLSFLPESFPPQTTARFRMVPPPAPKRACGRAGAMQTPLVSTTSTDLF